MKILILNNLRRNFKTQFFVKHLHYITQILKAYLINIHNNEIQKCIIPI